MVGNIDGLGTYENGITDEFSQYNKFVFRTLIMSLRVEDLSEFCETRGFIAVFRRSRDLPLC